ncbi:signal peptidase complex subunit 3-like protein [Cricetulus griseus]|uniref:Signal peptidase complex subunit 3 n=1 Tax=Cricetulus griseus TaxID=10029 RepID=A0A061IPA3_CRIGR|nr:signal peptidase complex subunit 3-like protein [Cricetulus griseus]
MWAGCTGPVYTNLSLQTQRFPVVFTVILLASNLDESLETLKIEFQSDCSSQNIFDWNVKQLFLYLSAEYSTKNNALNQVVLWDKIVLRGDNPKLLLKDMKTKYFFFDDGNGLKGNRNVTLTLSWNVVPNAGILPLVTGSGHVSVPFPDKYEITKSY